MVSKILKHVSHKAENQFELSLRHSFDLLEPTLRPPFPLTVPDPERYSQLTMAILYGVLSEPHFANAHLKHLHANVTDGYASFVALLVKLGNELFVELVDSAKNQFIWIAEEMVDVLGVGFDGLLVCLLRQIVGGDFSDGNLWLCSKLVSIFTSKWDTLLEEEPLVLTYGLYVFLRVLADHCKGASNVKLDAVRSMEIEFCVRVLREQFHLCLKIGRDLIRLLQDLVSVPEFESVWKDLILNPTQFRTPAFSDISQFYCLRTSSRYFLLRITPEMENQLRFLLTRVKFGCQKRYQVWFAKKFFSCVERESLIIDIVRFICCAHHPSNEILQSDITPRWAVIGWLLRCCTNDKTEANAKLALFFDWLFFDERMDNIMNIEPGLLLMACSIHNYIDITQNLLEFLFLLVEKYDVDHRDIINKGVLSSFCILAQKGVIPSLDVLTSCVALCPLIKEKLLRLLSGSSMGVPEEHQPTTVNFHSLPSPLKRKSTCASKENSVQISGGRLPSDSKKPRLSVPPLKLLKTFPLQTPTPSPKPRKADAPVADKGVLYGSKSSFLSVPLSSLPSVASLDSPTPPPTSQVTCSIKETMSTDTSLPIPSESATVCGASAVSFKSGADSLESLFHSLRETVKSSIRMSLQTLEAILLHVIKLDHQNRAIGLANPQILFSKIEKEYELNGCKLFTPLKCVLGTDGFDDDSWSVTALIIRTFIVSRHDKMRDLLLFWSKRGQPVGALLLYYASTLAYEVDNGGYLGNERTDKTCSKVNDSQMTLLTFHVNGHFAFESAGIKKTCEETDSACKMNKKLLTMLLDSAFAAYRSFLVHLRLSLPKETVESLSKLLLSDVLSCCDWVKKQLGKKSLFYCIFCYLSDISVGDEDIIRLLVSQLDNSDLVNMQFDISLQKCSIVGKNTERLCYLIKQSQSWDCLEQHKVWGLIRSEVAVSTHKVENILLQCFCSPEDDSLNAITAGGLLLLCNSSAPTPELVGAVMLLPDNKFKDFSASVLATWAVNNQQMLYGSLAKFSEKLDKNGDSIFSSCAGISINHSAMIWLLDYLNAHGVSGSNVLSNFSVHIRE